MLSFKHTGSFSKTTRFFEKMKRRDQYRVLNTYGREGVAALMQATPKDTGKTSQSWSYTVSITKDSASITWTNDNVTTDGTPIAVLIQYGHGTKSGGYVKGLDYINPAMRPIFEKITREIWEEVTR